VAETRWLTSIGVVAAHLAQAVALSRMVEATGVRARLAELNADISSALARSETLPDMLSRCTEAIVHNLGAAFARIWTLNDAEQVLELQASAGIYTHLNGRHGRIPMGQFKIGRIAKERLPHITNAVIGDPRVSDQEWARREGMVAFAGYPLILEDCVLGVMGMFATHALTPFVISALGSVAELIAVGIKRQRSEDRIRQLKVAVEQSPAAMVITDITGSIEYVNESFTRVTGYTPAEVLGRNPRLLQTGSTPVEEYQKLWATITGGGKWCGVLQNRRKNGELYWNEISISPIRDASGTIVKFVAVEQDITERKAVEDASREAADRFMQVTEHIKEAFYLVDLATGNNLYVSPTFEEIWGFSLAEVYARPQAWFEAVHPEDQPRMQVALDANARGENTSTEFRVTRPDGGVRWVRARSFPVRDATGRVYRLAGVSEDITQERSLEAQFAQSQKMEAVGRLAGGVAHDFNNLLTVITGYADLGMKGLPHESPLRRNLQEIRKAGERAVTLTRQLLAFSRQQVLAPRVLDLNMLVLGIEKMLQRLLGEDVELVSSLSPDLGRVHADAGQLEQVIVNLAVNARDAMPDGGKLTIQTANSVVDESHSRELVDVPAGHYVTLSVADTGYGMDEETRTRMFEPFFSTKAVGKGTGLGLSTVYGIVHQSGGCIWVQSEPGKGTLFKVHLPYLEALAESPRTEIMTAEGACGTETVLLVEDEEAVRTISQTALAEKGYRVLAAANGGEAILMSEQSAEPIQLLITDMVMPGVGGPELARRLGPLRPQMKVLFVSGYADRAVERQNGTAQQSAFLEKPFSMDALTSKVREVLDAE
jgi:PAS domain S-box-containing protein